MRTEEDARDYLLQGPIASYERFGFGLYLVALKHSGVPVGICGLLKRESLEDVDLGFALLPRFRPPGYGFESASAVLSYAGTSLGLTRIVAVTRSENVGSIRILDKLGLGFETTSRLTADSPEIELFGVDFQE